MSLSRSLVANRWPIHLSGTGSAVVMLHGVPTSADLWEPVISKLGDDRQVLAPDLPGYAGAPPLDRWDLGAHLDWLDEVLRAAGLPGDALHLVGNDYGGLMAAAWAARFGARSLTLTSTATDLHWLPARITALPGLRGFFYRRFEGQLWLREGISPARRTDFLDHFGPLAAAHPSLAAQMEATALGLPLRRLARLPADLRAAAVPTLWLWGAKDRFLSPAAAGRMAGPTDRVVVLPEGRHFLPWDQPQAYAAAMGDHWRRCERRSAG